MRIITRIRLQGVCIGYLLALISGGLFLLCYMYTSQDLHTKNIGYASERLKGSTTIIIGYGDLPNGILRTKFGQLADNPSESIKGGHWRDLTVIVYPDAESAVKLHQQIAKIVQ